MLFAWFLAVMNSLSLFQNEHVLVGAVIGMDPANIIATVFHFYYEQ